MPKARWLWRAMTLLRWATLQL